MQYFTTSSNNYPVSWTTANTSTTSLSWIVYEGPSDPSAPPCGVREPRRPLLPSGSASQVLALPEG
jgi:hypothetical protein